MPISRDVLRRAASQPHRPAVDGLSFADLADRAKRRADTFPGDSRVVLDDVDPLDLLVGLVAADIAGVPAVVADHSWPAAVRRIALTIADETLAAYNSSVRLVTFSGTDPEAPRPVARTTTSWTHSFPTFSALTGIDAGHTVAVLGPLARSQFLYAVLHALTMGAMVRLTGDTPPCTAVHGTAASLGVLSRTLRPSIAVSVDGDVDAEVAANARTNGVELVACYAPAELSVSGIRRAGMRVGRFRPFPGAAVSIDDGVIRVQSPYVAANADRYADGYATAGDHGCWFDEDDTFEVRQQQ